MATISLRDPALREKYGLRQENMDTVSIPSQWRETRQQHRSRAEARDLILQVLEKSDRPLSLTEIARAINRSKSPYFLHTIAEMVALGLLREYESSYRHFVMFVYEVA